MPCVAQRRRWKSSVRSEQEPTTKPSSRARRTTCSVTMPGGSPTSSVPSMSKLIRRRGLRAAEGVERDTCSGAPDLLGGLLDGADDLVVAGAATEVAGEPEADLLLGGGGVGVEQGLR